MAVRLLYGKGTSGTQLCEPLHQNIIWSTFSSCRSGNLGYEVAFRIHILQTLPRVTISLSNSCLRNQSPTTVVCKH